jgi:hypothetical protein
MTASSRDWPDADATYTRALEAGGVSLEGVRDQVELQTADDVRAGEHSVRNG